MAKSKDEEGGIDWDTIVTHANAFDAAYVFTGDPNLAVNYARRFREAMKAGDRFTVKEAIKYVKGQGV